MSPCRRAIRNFSKLGRFHGTRQFNKHFVKNIQKKRQGIILEFFLLDTVKTTFRMKFRLKSWAFFSKIRTPFSVFKKKKKKKKKKAGKALPLLHHSCAPAIFG